MESYVRSTDTILDRLFELIFSQLERRVRGLATRFREHASAGDRALLLYPPRLEFITAFLGCLAAGIIAVPAYPPRRNRSTDRLPGIIASARPCLNGQSCDRSRSNLLKPTKAHPVAPQPAPASRRTPPSGTRDNQRAAASPDAGDTFLLLPDLHGRRPPH